VSRSSITAPARVTEEDDGQGGKEQNSKKTRMNGNWVIPTDVLFKAQRAEKTARFERVRRNRRKFGLNTKSGADNGRKTQQPVLLRPRPERGAGKRLETRSGRGALIRSCTYHARKKVRRSKEKKKKKKPRRRDKE